MDPAEGGLVDLGHLSGGSGPSAQELGARSTFSAGLTALFACGVNPSDNWSLKHHFFSF